MMKYGMLFIIAAATASSALAQSEVQQIRDKPNYQSQRPLGAPGWPPTPVDPKAETDFGGTPRVRESQPYPRYSEQEQYARQASAWRRLRERERNRLGVNLSGDPTLQGRVPRANAAPASRASGSGANGYASPTYDSRPRPRYTSPSTYGQAVRQDRSWLQPNFGGAQPAAVPSYRPAPSRSASAPLYRPAPTRPPASPYGYGTPPSRPASPYGYGSSGGTSRPKRTGCSSYQVSC